MRSHGYELAQWRNSEQVVAAGPGMQGEGDKTIPLTIKDGDKVLYSKYAGADFKV